MEETTLLGSKKMEDLLYCKDMFGPIEGDKPEKMSDEEWKKQNRRTIEVIRQWLDDSVYHHVSMETNALPLWKKLESLYGRKTAGNKVLLTKKLVNLKFKDGTSVNEHLNEMQNIVNQLSSMNMVLDDELQALLLLSSLPDSWETLAISVINSAPDGVLSMNQVTASLLNEETRRKSMNSSYSGIKIEVIILSLMGVQERTSYVIIVV